MKGIPKITLEPANIVCPKCGSPNHMRHLIGEGVGELDMKCINCNSYFNFDEFYKQKIAEVIKPKQTNADRIRAMSDEELAEFISGKARTFGEEYEGYMSALDWLKEEAQCTSE